MTRIERYRSWFEEAIASDLASYDMLECKPIDLNRRQRTLPIRAMPTRPLSAQTITMPTEIAQGR